MPGAVDAFGRVIPPKEENREGGSSPPQRFDRRDERSLKGGALDNRLQGRSFADRREYDRFGDRGRGMAPHRYSSPPRDFRGKLFLMITFTGV